jgi:hypothetical protein
MSVPAEHGSSELLTLDAGLALKGTRLEWRDIPLQREGLDAGEQLRPHKELGEDQSMRHGNPLRHRGGVEGHTTSST